MKKNKDSLKENKEEQEINTQEAANEDVELVNEEHPLQKLADITDKYLRLYSDFDNFRRRVAKEKLEMMKTASEGVVLSLLPVVDDFERALQAFSAYKLDEVMVEGEVTKAAIALEEGVDLIYSKLMKVLSKNGVEQIVTKGEVFSDDFAEAIAQIPAPSDDKKGVVVEEIEKGYKMGDKVIRFAKVVVGV